MAGDIAHVSAPEDVRAYSFATGVADATEDQRPVIGDSAADLAALAAAGIPIPPGFTVVAARRGGAAPNGVAVSAVLRDATARLGQLAAGGNTPDPDVPPLLTAWRDDGPGTVAIPFVGLNDHTVEALVTTTGDEEFAPRAYHQLIRSFGEQVHGIPPRAFDDALARLKKTRALVDDDELAHEDWEEVVRRFKTVHRLATGAPFPQDRSAQLRAAVSALLADGGRSSYASANVQRIALGNLGPDSASGTTTTGLRPNGQLAGRFSPKAKVEVWDRGDHQGQDCDGELERWAPKAHLALRATHRALTSLVGEDVRFKFVIERGELFVV